MWNQTVFTLILFTVCKTTCALSFFKEPTFFEKLVSVLSRSISNTFQFGQLVIVKIPVDTIVLLCLGALTVILYRWFKRGRHRTLQPTTTISKPTNLNVFNTMQLDMERNDKKGHSGGAASNLVPKTIRNVEEFKVGMDMRSWITVLEIYLKHFNKDEWVEIVLSNMENKVLSRIKNLEKYLIDTDGYEELKKELLNLYTVKAVELPVNLSQLSIHKQSAKENIADFGKAIMEL
ncbi:hypothetical protein BpHYR1_037702, partial [Brachionus plicatilis]